MAALWSVPDFRFVTMPHPLAFLTPDQIELRAGELIDKVLSLLRDGQAD